MRLTQILTRAICCAVCAWFFCFDASAATFTVMNTQDAGSGSLRQAIADANQSAEDDVITFDAGVFNVARTIALTSGELTINGGGKLLINGTGASLLTIGGNSLSRVLRVANGDVTINDLTVAGGAATFAAGIYIESAARLTLNRVVVRNNSATGANGAGSGASGASASVGGIQVNGTLNLNNSIVRNNLAAGGAGVNGNLGTAVETGGDGGNAEVGGIAVINGTLNLYNSTVNDNQALGGTAGLGGRLSSGFGAAGGKGGTANAGGIQISGASLVNIRGSLIQGNRAHGAPGGKGGDAIGNFRRGGDGGLGGFGIGGGIYMTGGDVRITNSLFNDNSARGTNGGSGGASTTGGQTSLGGGGASGLGGAIYNNGATLAVYNTTIDGNSVIGGQQAMPNAGSNICGDARGGGIYGAATIISATVTRNQAASAPYVGCALEPRGGGLFGSISLGNTIVADNIVSSQFPTPTHYDLSGSFDSLGYNLIKDTTGATFTGTTTGNQTGVDPLLGALADNGGVTLTRAPAANSPVVNAGGDALAVNLTTDQRGGCFRRIVGAAADIGAVEVQAAVTRICSTAFDFDGDRRSDYAVFRPSNNFWYLQQSALGFNYERFGLSGDRLVPADYDGDGKTDIAVFRPSARIWYLLSSSTNTVTAFEFGLASDTPVPADYDGDGKADIAVFRNGIWYIQQSANNQFRAVQFGLATDKTVPADYDGDGKIDVAVFRNGIWYWLRSSDNNVGAVQFGITSDKVVPADYDGDGRADQAVYRDGVWYLNRSTAGFTGVFFGIASDKTAAADYDGDGKADIAVWRFSSGTFYLQRSANNSFGAFQFGADGDVPIASIYFQ